ncbi:MAG: hypothetical protein JF886_04865 [Candidatus Dormibacteraeota bacterium]|uniref:Uncharacterized protein n=1 Tax=Candidatus Aeolococcus gillhamiae TaxID=3127015 RepID=A0A934N9F8_9BACT|nr:hypothetical protein [Candidatus Dormibacteraeota bacterium]
MPQPRTARSRVLLVDDDARLVHIVGLYLAARQAGADEVIIKPFNLTGLGAAVEALLPDTAAASA